MSKKIIINLSGPLGNSYALLGLAKELAEPLGKDFDAIRKEMIASDYSHLVEIFKREFGEFVILINGNENKEDHAE